MLAGTGAQAASAADACPNAAIRTQQRSTSLPDCRGYEKVSPNNKNGGDVTSGLRVSEDGRAIAYLASNLFEIPETESLPGMDMAVAYVGRRGSSGWTTDAFSPGFGAPDAQPLTSNFLRGYVFDAALRQEFAVTAGNIDPDDQDFAGLLSMDDVYSFGARDRGEWRSAAQTRPDTGPYTTKLSGVAEDGRTVFFTTPQPLTADVPDDTQSWLYRSVGGHVEAVGKDEHGDLLAGGSVLGEDVSSASAGQQTGSLADSAAISHDGTRFVVRGAKQPGDPYQVYLHRDGASSTLVSLSQRSGTIGQPASSGAEFLAAADDLARILFYSPDQLTDAAPVGGGDYWYDVASGALTYSNPDDSFPWFIGAPIGLTRVSPDGHRTYFVTPQALAAGAVAGATNLYLAHDGAVRFIATLNDGDSEVASAPHYSGVVPTPDYTSTGVSADGLRLVFQSRNQLTAEETNGHIAVYLFDDRASGGKLSCLSCTSSAGGSQGDATLTGYGFSAPPRAITDDGSTVVFSTTDALVAQDDNQQADVYRWKDGEVALISDGRSSRESRVVGMSQDGADIYFETRAPLTSLDDDAGLVDIYDARVDGGFPEPPAAALACSGDAFQGVPTAAPVAPTIGSVAFQGAANVADGDTDRDAKASVSVSALKTVTGTQATLKVKVPAAGAITLSGSSLKQAKRSAAKAATYAVRFSLSAKAKASLKRHRTLRVGVKVTFTSRSGATASKTVTVSFKQPKAAKHASHRAASVKRGDA